MISDQSAASSHVLELPQTRNPITDSPSTYSSGDWGEAGTASPAASEPTPLRFPDSVPDSFESRSYDPEAQANIYRATKDTSTDPGEVPDSVLDVHTSPSQPLNDTIQRTLEERMDADFSNVRIHTGAKAAEAADAIDAKAFTCGNDIVFNSGEYDPNSAEGQFLLAHELAHVTQQTGAAISMMPQEGADLEIDPDPQLEREADQAAEQALSADEPLIVSRMGTDVHIQRTATDDSGFASPSQIRKLVSEEIEQRVPEEVDKRLEQRSEELEEMLSGSGELDEEALEDLGVDLDAIDTGEGSWWERLRDGATDNRTAVTAGVGATFAALTTVASAGALPLAAGAAVAASGAFASNMLGKGAADAALGEESNLSPEEFATIVETVKRELQESDETGVEPVAGEGGHV
ncbi:hypothetical protein C482_11560 [Natrialba chahannaoensis JCM 10990]|uniref:eCIS core domain-containing protein n=1 Tax=Natrialba chahannaoensis JCM 10990 TaxID=1227492 RepID=M0ALA7_9EURY|nr:DUF4157 domain-containing protein [Natrialba chahannaoensis]ELY98712.1 hypothetical protein C482_11560 [Natrialba chahannaoensis JCM 10990]